MPAPVAEKVKLEAVAFIIAGLSIRDTASRLGVSARSLGTWASDKQLRRKAVQLYMKAVEDARARRSGVSRREARVRKEMQEAAQLANRPKAYRRAKAINEAKDAEARKVVVVHQTIIAPQVEEEEEVDMVAALRQLADKFEKPRRK